MGGKLENSRQVLREFLATKNSQDEFALVQSQAQPAVVRNFSRNVEEIQNLTSSFRSQGPSALLDAIYLALNQMNTAQNRKKAVLVISDGGESGSRYTASELKNALSDADVQIYVIGMNEPGESARTWEEKAGPKQLGEMADLTGGLRFDLEHVSDSRNIASQVSSAMHGQR
jgi:Ca-activated chloride channel family protein